MKTEIVGELTQENEIDWSKPITVENSFVIVRTNGNHKGNTFEGVSIFDKCPNENLRSMMWFKSAFKPITQPITIKFSNE